MKKSFLLASCLFSWLLLLATSQCYAQNPTPVFLDRWVVIQECTNASSLNGILPNGTQIQVFSPLQKAFWSAEFGGGSVISANRSSASLWETFRLLRINDTTFNFIVNNNNFIGLPGNGSGLVSVATTPGATEAFVISRDSSDPFRVRFLASNGKYLQAASGNQVTADYGGSTSDWSDGNPSVFEINTVGTLKCITTCGYFV